MENKYLAKTEGEKTIKEHTDDLLRQYDILKSMHPHILSDDEWEILEFAVKFHDLGKINSKFQNKLYGVLKYKERIKDYNVESQEVPHNFLSPFFIDGPNFEDKYKKDNTKALVTAVYYHHDRKEVEHNVEEIKRELNKQIQDIGDFYGLKLTDVKKKFNRYILRTDEEKIKSKKYIMIKGLLNKLDYVASLDKNGINIEEPLEEGRKGHFR